MYTVQIYVYAKELTLVYQATQVVIPAIYSLQSVWFKFDTTPVPTVLLFKSHLPGAIFDHNNDIDKTISSCKMHEVRLFFSPFPPSISSFFHFNSTFFNELYNFFILFGGGEGGVKNIFRQRFEFHLQSCNIITTRSLFRKHVKFECEGIHIRGTCKTLCNSLLLRVQCKDREFKGEGKKVVKQKEER